MLLPKNFSLDAVDNPRPMSDDERVRLFQSKCPVCSRPTDPRFRTERQSVGCSWCEPPYDPYDDDILID